MNAFFSLWVEKFHDSFLAIFIYFHAIATIMTVAYVAKPFGMDSKPLTQQSLFWLAIIIPIFSFLYFGIFSWYPFDIQLGGENYKDFIVNNAFPLGLLSLSIPFTAIVNNIHRTIQTNEQISQTQSKNSIDFYLNHKKSAIEYFEKNLKHEIITITKKHPLNNKKETPNELEIKTLINIKNPYYLYNKMFIFSNDSRGLTSELSGISTHYFDEINQSWVDINIIFGKYIIPTSYEEPSKYKYFISSLESTIIRLMEALEIDISKLSYSSDKSSKYHYSLFNTKLLDNIFLKSLLKSLHSITLDIFMFVNKEPIKSIDFFWVEQYMYNDVTLITNNFDYGLIKNHTGEPIAYL
ncbi:hypothetical protein EC835_102448 [Providencia alcalifaciens]|uniref:Uncharacterized protein n=1 Tax=Providencia alcalifaciens TaxID=126385 RepID=A0A4R3NPW6_9GAMM|nr:hypothetical protein [Providencia alcalifaciens]TCT36983.1 hypothetical protein EC835_102448 [Providencia alcalifaciens]